MRGASPLEYSGKSHLYLFLLCILITAIITTFVPDAHAIEPFYMYPQSVLEERRNVYEPNLHGCMVEVIAVRG